MPEGNDGGNEGIEAAMAGASAVKSSALPDFSRLMPIEWIAPENVKLSTPAGVIDRGHSTLIMRLEAKTNLAAQYKIRLYRRTLPQGFRPNYDEIVTVKTFEEEQEARTAFETYVTGLANGGVIELSFGDVRKVKDHAGAPIYSKY